MLYFVKKAELIKEIQSHKRRGKTIAFVPTMGALHEGHLSLLSHATECDVVVVSIFINPLQFNNLTDLEKYPKDLERDKALLQQKCDILFAPTRKEIYDTNPVLSFDFGSLEDKLEGISRPRHFSGVGIVVSKLLNIVQPDKAFFGQKDLQQLMIIRTLVRDLSMNVEIIGCPIVRDQNGLAMSSRNQRLSENAKQIAEKIFVGLSLAKQAFKSGKNLSEIKEEVLKFYSESSDLYIEYVEFVDGNFRILSEDPGNGEIALCVAANVEGIRLIDNLYLRTQD